MIIEYKGIYENIVKKCYISEGYTDYNDLVVILENGTILSNNYNSDSLIFEMDIDKLVKVYIDGENRALIMKRKMKIDKLLK